MQPSLFVYVSVSMCVPACFDACVVLLCSKLSVSEDNKSDALWRVREGEGEREKER